MPRIDLSDSLVHWIKGDDQQAAFEILREIVSGRQLLGGDGHIKGEYRCVCFSDAPENAFLARPKRYQPFGIKVPKRWLFSQGGRPVIYQPDIEFEMLPESHKWRHVRYEPDAVFPTDFSWEREWRVQTHILTLPAGVATILVPHEKWANNLVSEYDETECSRIRMDALAYGEEWLQQAVQPFHFAWSVLGR